MTSCVCRTRIVSFSLSFIYFQPQRCQDTSGWSSFRNRPSHCVSDLRALYRQYHKELLNKQKSIVRGIRGQSLRNRRSSVPRAFYVTALKYHILKSLSLRISVVSSAQVWYLNVLRWEALLLPMRHSVTFANHCNI